MTFVAAKIYEYCTCTVVYKESACVGSYYCALNGCIACTCCKNFGNSAYLGGLLGLFASFALAGYQCYIIDKERCSFTVFVVHNVYGNLGCCIQRECKGLLFPFACSCLGGGIVVDVVFLCVYYNAVF